MGGSVVRSASSQPIARDANQIEPFFIDAEFDQCFVYFGHQCSRMLSFGSTLASLPMTRSNTHSAPVTVTNIVLHPGHSRIKFVDRKDISMHGVCCNQYDIVCQVGVRPLYGTRFAIHSRTNCCLQHNHYHRHRRGFAFP